MMSDAEAKDRLRQWPNTTQIWSPEAGPWWLRAQPGPGVRSSPPGPRLVIPGAQLFKTQPDGLWITTGILRSDNATVARFADCIAIEVCNAIPNLNDKRSRYAARTTSLMIELGRRWLDDAVSVQRGARRRRREVLRGNLPDDVETVELPVRHLRVLYIVRDDDFDNARDQIIFEAHEFLLPQRILRRQNSWNQEDLQCFLKRMRPSNSLFGT